MENGSSQTSIQKTFQVTFQTNSEKAVSRGAVRVHDTNENFDKMIKQKKREEEKQEDEVFLSTFKTNNSIELINSFRDKL